MRISRRLKYVLAVPAFLVATIALQFGNVQLANAATLTWDGSAGDNNFSTGANWSTGSAPTNGDVINFDISALSAHATLNNDISNLSLAGINVTGAANDYNSYTITGNAFTLTGPVTNNVAYDDYAITFNINNNITLRANVAMTGVFSFGGTINTAGYNLSIGATTSACGTMINRLSGSGDVTLNATQYGGYTLSDSPAYTGSVTVNSGTLVAVDPAALNTAEGVQVTGSGKLSLYSGANSTWTVPMTLGGSGWIAAQHGSTGFCSGGSDPDVYTATLSGPVTLTSNFLYNGSDNLTITGTYTSNGHTFTVNSGATGTLTTPDGSEEAGAVETNIDGDQPTTHTNVVYRETATLNGTRDSISVASGGTLKGTGSVNDLYNDGVVAPGNSPGTLNVLETYSGSGALEIEILNKDTYDQLRVGENYTGGSNAVSLYSGATLNLVMFDGWSVNNGDQFTIIDNRSSTAVSGTFEGLAEGQQFSIDGITFNITYVGGDGNDIVITALNSGTDPSTPNTGVMKLVQSNPALVAGLGIITAGLLIVLAVRRKVTQ
ncbi:hypothetical protein CMN24_03335 [Candidatus Saccharibacteria bacterium]|nr:hypothetical protein [Candidatus Saccharibacteria bacterium]